MLFNLNKAPDNMLLNSTKLDTMYHEQQVEIYNNEKNRIIAEQAEERRERESYIEQQNQYIQERINSGITRSEKLLKIKESFISECIYKLYCESVHYPLTSKDKIIARNLVNKFVIENGAGNLITSFATKNMILSEFSRISQKYYNKILESCDNENECMFTGQISDNLIGQDTVDDFYKELSDINIEDASKAIKDRVADAISEFIDINAANKLEYEEIIKSAQDKIDAMDDSDETIAESYINIAKRKINDMKNTREKNVFNYMVESLTTSTFKDELLKNRFINEGSVDMDGIVESAQLLYTMLEMVNTTDMVNVNEEFISNYLNSL